MLYPRGLRDTALAALLCLVAAPAAAKPMPSYLLWEQKWDALVARSGGEPGCIIRSDVEFEIITSAYSNTVTIGRTSETIGVFDLERTADRLDRVFMVPPGTKVKEVWAWSHELGAAGVTWATEKDIHQTEVLRGWKEIRVSVPGLSRTGVCGAGIETKSERFPYISEDFMTDLPVLEGELRLIFPRVAATGAADMNEDLDKYMTTIIRGPVTEVPYEFTDRGFTRAYRVSALPARPEEPLTLASDRPRAEIQVVSNMTKWKHWIASYDEELQQIVLPKGMVKSARDTLGSASPTEVVRAVARRLDDPRHFRLTTAPRSSRFHFGDLEDVVKTKEGDAFDKAVLAHTLLKNLNVESFVVFGASRERTIVDGRVADPWTLDSALLWIPAISNSFVWDIASRSVPLGEAGADLYPEMVVCDVEADTYGREFGLSEAKLGETRAIDLTLDEDGVLDGTLTYSCVGWPLVANIDPWDETEDLHGALRAALPVGVEVDSVRWVARDRDVLRCSPESPAVLTCRVSLEATPQGESGWAVKPFLGKLPRQLTGMNLAERKLPVFLPRRIEVTEKATIHLGGRRPARTPAPVHINNRAGFFECAWESTAEGVIARRTLALPVQRAAGDRLPDFLALCKAWRDAAEGAVDVE